jgi:hypothetical protein
MVAGKRRGTSSKDRLKKAQLSFYAESEAYERLKGLSARTGVPQQVYLRLGLMHILRPSIRIAIRADGVSRPNRRRFNDQASALRKMVGSSSEVAARSLRDAWLAPRLGWRALTAYRLDDFFADGSLRKTTAPRKSGVSR